MIAPYTPPEFKKTAFHCPRCGVYAQQFFSPLFMRYYQNNSERFKEQPELFKSGCAHCHRDAFWFGGRLFDPPSGNAPAAHPEMPEDVRGDYDEAKSIVEQSPRGAAAMLRLAIQKLVIHLGEKGDDLNTDIANLVKKGLPQQIQQALDFVRVVGNESVHPGVLDMKDNREVAGHLFELVNVVIDRMTAEPKRIDALYQKVLPESKRAAIEKRDEKQ